MSKYQKYPRYKNSEKEYYGYIPAHWSLEKIKFNSYVKGRQGWQNLRADEYQDSGPYLVTGAHFDNIGGVDWSSCHHVSEKRYERDKDIWLQEADVLITKDGTIGKVAYIDQLPDKACLNSHLLVIRDVFGKYDQRFLYHLLNSNCFKGFIPTRQSGTTFMGITQESVEEFPLVICPINEQKQISLFLDHEIAKIDTLIEKQQQLIKLLKEKCQAVITHAVTKGLNPEVPMKDSGVEWLGEVPEHWQVTRAKFVSEIFVPQRNKPDINDSAGTVWITMENMGQKYIYETEKFISPESAKAAGSKVLKAHSVIASCVGNFGISSINKVDAIINQQLQAFQPKKIEAEYLQSIVEISKPYFQSIGTAATLIYVNQEGFENLPVLVPPQNEQECICSFIEGKEAKFRDLIGKSIIQIDLLKERRSALISAAVTGKIDVRNWKPTDNNNTKELEVTA